MNYWQDEVSAPVVSNELSLIVPHCPVVLVLDTSHSMWGQGLVDLKNALIAFYRSVGEEVFQEAQIDIETIRMGENFGVMESFTPIAGSTLLNTAIRPKGDTPLGASLTLALDEIDQQLARYRQKGINSVIPQLIVLSDGKSSDPFQNAAAEIRSRLSSGRLICRAIALGNDPDYDVLNSFSCGNIVDPDCGKLPDAFRKIGRIVSQEYEASAAEVIVGEAVKMSSASENMFLLDGTNMLYWDEIRSGISLQHILNVTEYLRNSGKKFIVYFDASTLHRHLNHSPEDCARYKKLLKTFPDNFRQVPAGSRADDILLIEADQNPKAIILSNDRYRDYEEQYAWLKEQKRVAPGMVLSDKIVFPKINLIISVSRTSVPNLF